MLPIEEILDSEARSPLRSLRPIGRSREGRDILGAVLGSGPRHVSLIGGCHPDEPVGPAMLRRLVSHLSSRPDTRYTWYIVPHVNPDGEARNAAWSEPGLREGTFDLGLFLRHAVREKPGDDMEFGFPDGRPENQAVADFLAGGAPFILHGSFHSIAFAPGPWFLLEPAWVDRTASLRNALRERVRALGYGLFDVDRGGEKGFWRIDEGFTTRPDSRSMIAWFEERGDL